MYEQRTHVFLESTTLIKEKEATGAQLKPATSMALI